MRVSPEKLHTVSFALLRALGSDEAEADIVSRHLVDANLKGHDSHGVGMLAEYLPALRDGRLTPNTPARLLNDGGAVLQFSGDRGYGQRTGFEAMNAAIERARTTGVVLMTLQRTNHLGRIGTYGEQAAAAGMISLHFVNVNEYQPLVAPFAGTQPRFGTNPICIAIPASAENPAFVLDFATSIVAMGKTRVAYLAGTQFEEDVVLDNTGNPTHDPTPMWEGEPRGALMPMGRHKGSGLTLAAELLAGLLSGGGTIQPGHSRDGAIVNNMTTIVIDPTKLAPRDWFGAEYDAMLDYVRSSDAPDPVHNPILIAGEPERIRAQQRGADGVEISAAEWERLVVAGREFGVSPDLF